MINTMHTTTPGLERTVLDPLTFLLVDDSSRYRQIVRRIILSQPDWQIIGEAGDGLQALELVALLRPHIVCMDINIPYLNGIEATRRIKQLTPTTRVLVITGYDDEEFQRESLAAGAECLLRKEDIDAHRLIQQISSALRPSLAHTLR